MLSFLKNVESNGSNDDFRVAHNRAIAKYFVGGRTDQRELLESFRVIRGKMSSKQEGVRNQNSGLDAKLSPSDLSLFLYNEAVTVIEEGSLQLGESLLEELHGDVDDLEEYLSVRITLLLAYVCIRNHKFSRAWQILDKVPALSSTKMGVQIDIRDGKGVSGTKLSSSVDVVVLGLDEGKSDCTDEASRTAPPHPLALSPQIVRHSYVIYMAFVLAAVHQYAACLRLLDYASSFVVAAEDSRMARDSLHTFCVSQQAMLGTSDNSLHPPILHDAWQDLITASLNVESLSDEQRVQELLRISSVCSASQKNSLAVSCLQKALKLVPVTNRPTQATVLWRLGVAHLHVGQGDVAFECLWGALSYNTESPVLWMRIAEACILCHESVVGGKSTGDHQIPWLRSAAGFGNSYRLLLPVGESTYEYLSARERNSPSLDDHPRPTLGLGQKALCNALALIDPDDDQHAALRQACFLRLAYISLSMNSPLDAIEASREVRGPTVTAVQQERGGLDGNERLLSVLYTTEALISMQKMESATSLLSAAVSSEHDSDQPLDDPTADLATQLHVAADVNLATLRENEGKLKVATQLLERAHKMSPNQKEPVLGLVHIAMQRRKYEEALSWLRERPPTDPDAASE